ncbi:MAG: hypothetical protein Q4G44_06065 [Alcaligenaceae bacterium]|nr:hypothetical protein [Alcaligenaceae bacterium]
MARYSNKKNKADRDGAQFLALPHVVIESEAFKSLTGNAIKLLIDIAVQFNAMNNGRLSASWTYLSKKRGWTSKSTIKRSLNMLEDRNLIFCTRKGGLPNKAAWYAVTWHGLNHHKDMDCDPQSLPRGEYKRWKPK